MTIHEGSGNRAIDLTPRGATELPGGVESPGDGEYLGDGESSRDENSPGDGESSRDEEPLCSEEEFAEEVRELVAEDAPRVFALVEEHGERYDAWVCAWGLAFDDHVEVFSTASKLRMTFDSAERAQQRLSRRRKIRLVWASPATARQPEQVG